MKTICPYCDYSFEYNNIYGTRCRKCKKRIPSEDEPEFVKENKKKKEMLLKQFFKKSSYRRI